MMYDTSAVKPEDWDESQPKKIVDTHATKPDTWDENVPTTIADPAVSKPSGWDDEEVSLVACCLYALFFVPNLVVNC